MKFAGRMNSFIKEDNLDLFQTIDLYKNNMQGVTHLEFNYPEHIEGYDMDEIKKNVGDMKVNGIATRFKEDFISGEFTNPSKEIRKQAIQLCKNAVDACVELGGEVLTVWLGYDGFDYAFQIDYEDAWNRIVESFKEIADYAGERSIKVSIEYKPFEPRSYSMIDSIGLTMLIIKEVDRENLGVTLDYCHMLMKHENPAYGLALAAKEGKLFGLHLNDGYKIMDDGVIFGTASLVQALEVVYYIKKYKYDGVIFFDTFPFRENSKEQTLANIQMYNTLSDMVDSVGLEKIQGIVNKQDGVSAQRLILDLIGSKNNRA